MKITQEQYNNIGYLSNRMHEILPEFRGFNGSKDDMKVYGVSEELVKIEIDKIDLSGVEKEKTLEERISKLEGEVTVLKETLTKEVEK